jgi:CheY-like chemotaxis protein
LPVAGPFLQIAVTDTGIGIKPSDQERVFNEFEQVDSSYGRQQQGTGLGLALTRRLIEMHGGRIWVESQGIEGKGSTFTFLLPLLQEEYSRPQSNGKPKKRDDTIRPLALLVTNDDSHERLIGSYLASAGYDVTVVSETEEMLQALKERRPYTVLIDEKMGGLSRLVEPSQSDHSDTLIEHKYRSCVTPEIPQVIFSEDSSGQLIFRLLVSGKVPQTNFSLANATRQTDYATITGPENLIAELDRLETTPNGKHR